MNDTWIIAYVCVGGVVLLLFVIFRLRVKDESLLLGSLSASEWCLILYACLWPIFLPLFVWSLRRSYRRKRTFEQIVASLAALKPEDFDLMRPDSNGPERLKTLTDELMALPHPERGVRPMFDVMERMAESDLGSPGPLVHTLEQMRGHYESELVESIKRRPTPLAVWMVNRILNATHSLEQRRFYMDLLRFAAEHPATPQSAKRQAHGFIEYQTKAV